MEKPGHGMVLCVLMQNAQSGVFSCANTCRRMKGTQVSPSRGLRTNKCWCKKEKQTYYHDHLLDIGPSMFAVKSMKAHAGVLDWLESIDQVQ